MGETPLAIVLAAGLSTRMRSETPKVLHPLAGRLLLQHVLCAVREAGATPLVVMSKDGAAARELIGAETAVVVQDPPRGTGDAVRVALSAAPADQGIGYIVYGDTPLLRAATLRSWSVMPRLPARPGTWTPPRRRPSRRCPS